MEEEVRVQRRQHRSCKPRIGKHWCQMLCNSVLDRHPFKTGEAKNSAMDIPGTRECLRTFECKRKSSASLKKPFQSKNVNMHVWMIFNARSASLSSMTHEMLISLAP